MSGEEQGGDQQRMILGQGRGCMGVLVGGSMNFGAKGLSGLGGRVDCSTCGRASQGAQGAVALEGGVNLFGFFWGGGEVQWTSPPRCAAGSSCTRMHQGHAACSSDIIRSFEGPYRRWFHDDAVASSLAAVPRHSSNTVLQGRSAGGLHCRGNTSARGWGEGGGGVTSTGGPLVQQLGLVS
jgi:hypothetical protein